MNDMPKKIYVSPYNTWRDMPYADKRSGAYARIDDDTLVITREELEGMLYDQCRAEDYRGCSGWNAAIAQLIAKIGEE